MTFRQSCFDSLAREGRERNPPAKNCMMTCRTRIPKREDIYQELFMFHVSSDFRSGSSYICHYCFLSSIWLFVLPSSEQMSKVKGSDRISEGTIMVTAANFVLKNEGHKITFYCTQPIQTSYNDWTEQSGLQEQPLAQPPEDKLTHFKRWTPILRPLHFPLICLFPLIKMWDFKFLEGETQHLLLSWVAVWVWSSRTEVQWHL